MNKYSDYLRTTIAYLLIPLVATLVSLVMTGFQYGISNNVFHIPYVLRFSELPEFQEDKIYQTLNYFTSIVWPIIRLIANEENIQDIFRGANFISRYLAFAGILFLIRVNGLKTFFSALICITVVSVTPWLIGVSVIGLHGIFISYFTHSEVTWFFIFMSLSLLQLHRTTAAAAFIGLTFAINAFIGIWLLAVVLFTMLYSRINIDKAIFIKFAAAFLLFASPVVLWIISSIIEQEPASTFSYIEYIRAYYPGHFLIEETSWHKLAILAFIFICGFLAAQFMQNKRYWVGIQIGCLLIFFIGVFLPYLFDSRNLFNLHLLRSDGLEQMIAIILTAIAGTKMLLDPSSVRRQLLGVVILLSLVSFPNRMEGLIIVFLALLAGVISNEDKGQKSVSVLLEWIKPYANGLVIVAVVGFWVVFFSRGGFGGTQFTKMILALLAFYLILHKSHFQHRERVLVFVIAIYCLMIPIRNSYWQYTGKISNAISEKKQSWIDFVNMVKSSSLKGVFLVPINNNGDLFQLQSRKSVWVDWKQGAAVMWAPSFYEQWMQRYIEVSNLKSADDFIAYAKDHRIQYVVLATENSKCPDFARLEISTKYYVLCSVED